MKLVYSAVLLLITSHIVLAQQKKLPSSASSDWYANASTYINQVEYAFHSLNTNNSFTAVNNANRLYFNVSASGYTARPLQTGDKKQNWQVDFRLPIKKADLSREENGSLLYSTPAINVEYVHTEQGLRQNFIVNKKPLHNNALTINMQLSTTLKATVINSSKLAFYDAAKPAVTLLSYEDLRVWDASGRSLSATMKLDEETKQFSIIVDDKDAVYPVTVDPLNKAPEWTGSADGITPALLTSLQVQALYGHSLTGLGDINNDGFDDVAVSAPGMADVITGSGSLLGVGAVYIYLGSATGLSTVPAKVLQPTTAVAGALFGFSIDAGDVTGDNIPDIVISAPGDSYSTQATGLLGPVNVTVTAGKVYLYRSEDLFTASNPSPFLQLRLQGTGFFSTGVLGLLDNTSVNALFGYSVAITEDLNNDNKKDIIIGSPAYLGTNALAVKSGAAFIYYSNNLSTVAPVQLDVPTPTVLGLLSLPIANLGGLLYGYSVDGIGDYNNDGNADVVVGAPAGVDLSSLGGIFSGQVLGGSAYIYYGSGTNAGISHTIGASLRASSASLLSNTANLFGLKVKGVRNAAGARNGNVLISTPVGSVLSNVVGGLQIKAGQLHVFPKQTNSFSSPVTSVQVLSSPRATSVLSVLAGRTINASMLYGAGLDNIRDVNCDTYADIVVGEPLSNAIAVVGTDVVGGAAYIYTGKADGTYQATPSWSLYPEVSALLGVNATSLIGYSVAGAGYTEGVANKLRVLVGGPSNTLDFGTGLLNLSNTIGTLNSFAFDANGLGKTYSYNADLCNLTTLPVSLTQFSGRGVDNTSVLEWQSANEDNVNFYELQRSVGGRPFEAIAMVFAKGAIKNEYNYIDKNTATGTNLYRLKMTDNDSKFTYSQVVSVRFSDKTTGAMVVSPNPVRSEFTVQLKDMERGVYTLKLYNVSGQVLRSVPVTINQSKQSVSMSSQADLMNGIYWLSLYDRSGMQSGTVKVVISKN